MFAYVLLLMRNVKLKLDTSCIKKFDFTKHKGNQKYKVEHTSDGVQFVEDGVILHVAETEEALDIIIQNQRSTRPPLRTLISATESSSDDDVINRRNNSIFKRQIEDADLWNDRIKKRLSSVRASRQENISSLQPKIQTTFLSESEPHVSKPKIISNFSIKKLVPKDKDVSMYVAEIEQLKEKVKINEEELKKTKMNYEEVVKEMKIYKETVDELHKEAEVFQENLMLQEEELMALRNINEELERNGIENHRQSLENITQRNSPPTNSYAAVGSLNEDKSKIHLGRNIWLSTDAYALAVSQVPKNRIKTFPKNILVALFGYNDLCDSTVTGHGSNRNQRTKNPSKRLDPKMMLAIKDIYQHWLINEKNYNLERAEIEADGSYKQLISKKIAQIKRTKRKAYETKQERNILGQIVNQDQGLTDNSNYQVEGQDVSLPNENDEEIFRNHNLPAIILSENLEDLSERNEEPFNLENLEFMDA